MTGMNAGIGPYNVLHEIKGEYYSLPNLLGRIGKLGSGKVIQ